MMNFSLVCFLLVGIMACKENDQIGGSFNKEVNDFFSKYYLLDNERQLNIDSKDSLRSEQFFSPGLQKGSFYRYKGKLADSIHSMNADFTITIYEYSSVDTAIIIINDFEKEKKRRTEEGLYGPLDKNYQFFLQDLNYLVHFEALCSSSKEEEWSNIRDSLNKITIKHFGKNYKGVIKPCE